MAEADSDFLQRMDEIGLNEGPTEERRILLLGKVGAGKSATGNAIIGENVFLSRKSFKSVTDKCAFKSTVRNGKRYVVFDTPGAKGLADDRQKFSDSLKRCLYVTSPGFHAIVFVISADQRIQESDLEMFKEFEKLLKGETYKYSIVVFTHIETDELDDLVMECKEIKEICDKCNERYLSFGNSKNVDKSLVHHFEQELEKLIRWNKNSPFYEHQLYSKAYEFILKDAEELQKTNRYLTHKASIEKAKERAFVGQSPRDRRLLNLATKCCVII